ncbi:MAG: cupin domain-containing protein [Terracidiphilus sp.]|nr:cupin domain-containing protein [Terracidiphilus sp.]
MITRRNTLVGLAALPALLQAASTAAQTSEPAATPPGPVLGPTVFHWNEMKPVKNDKGEVRSLCRQPTATIDQLEMHITTLNPGMASHPPHTHVNEELIILREGLVETLSNGQWVRVEPGSVIFNASNSLHGLRNVGTVPATYHVINWSPDKTKIKS